jgi:hypothetical protein
MSLIDMALLEGWLPPGPLGWLITQSRGGEAKVFATDMINPGVSENEPVDGPSSC